MNLKEAQQKINEIKIQQMQIDEKIWICGMTIKDKLKQFKRDRSDTLGSR